MLRTLSSVVALAALTQTASAQSSWDRYVSRRLGAIVAAHDSSFRATARTMAGVPGRHVSGDQLPSRATVRFSGSFRPISTEHIEFIQGYFAHVMHRQLPPGFLEQEVLVTEDSVQYWLPVQTQLVPALQKESEPGRQVCLFVIWLGALNDGANLDWIFVINEFDTDVARCR